jgi:hypothetical protein
MNWHKQIPLLRGREFLKEGKNFGAATHPQAFSFLTWTFGKPSKNSASNPMHNRVRIILMLWRESVCEWRSMIMFGSDVEEN